MPTLFIFNNSNDRKQLKLKFIANKRHNKNPIGKQPAEIT